MAALVAALLAVTAAPASDLHAPLAPNPWLARHPLLIAHQGGAYEAPANTLYAFKSAMANRVDVLEMDVHLSSDGHIVVIHDATVDRTTDGTGFVRDKTLGELKALDAAFCWRPGRETRCDDADDAEYHLRGVATGQRDPPEGYAPGDFRIPTLPEVLEAIRQVEAAGQRLVWIMVEIKYDPRATALPPALPFEDRVAQVLADTSYGRSADDTIVAAGGDDVAERFRLAAAARGSGFSMAAPTAAAFWVGWQRHLPAAPSPLYQVLAVPPVQATAAGEVTIIDDGGDFVQDAHANGLAVHAWTINEEEEMRRLLGLGVDGIITDRPSLLQGVISGMESRHVFLVVVDGLRPEDLTPSLMPRLTALLDQPCEPGGSCATVYEQARAVMVTETEPNHIAMLTGAYGGTSGMFASDAWDRRAGEKRRLDRPQLNLAETMFDVIEARRPDLSTAAVVGKDKLRRLLDCTRTETGECGSSDDNPEARPVEHRRPDHLGGATTSPTDPRLDCPAEIASGSGFALGQCVMDVTLHLLKSVAPHFALVNLPDVDAASHLFGPGTPPALAAVADADRQIGRLVDRLRRLGRWDEAVVILTSDHNFGALAPANVIFLDQIFLGFASNLEVEPFAAVSHGGSASVYLTSLEDPGRELTAGEQATLKALREAALATPGIQEALYRRPNHHDGGGAHTLEAVHPTWGFAGTGRVGDLFLTAEENYRLREHAAGPETLLVGEHGHPSDRHVPLIVLGGDPHVRDGRVPPSSPPAVDERDDTARLEEQAEVVDLPPPLHGCTGREPRPRARGACSPRRSPWERRREPKRPALVAQMRTSPTAPGARRPSWGATAWWPGGRRGRRT